MEMNFEGLQKRLWDIVDIVYDVDFIQQKYVVKVYCKFVEVVKKFGMLLLIVSCVILFVVGLVVFLIIGFDQWYKDLNKLVWIFFGFIFGLIWIFIYFFMGLVLWLVWVDGGFQ